ncbi:MAG: hypothetical protein K8R74_06245 [Bacteroidales bacterium]|nr:hypothetical protein [Bacteroidales bacterium]
MGVAHWDYPNNGATNESGFTALPGGSRFDGIFNNLEIYGNYWTSSVSSPGYSNIYTLYYNGPSVQLSGFPHNGGISVRCLKD